MPEDFQEESYVQIIDKNKGYFIIPNALPRKWLRVIGSSAFTVWCLLKSFCTSDNQFVFAKVKQTDWAEYCGFSLSRFQAALKKLESTGLITIDRPTGEDRLKHRPVIYILEIPSEDVPDNLKPPRLSKENAFVDPIYNGESLFKKSSEKDSGHVKINKSGLPRDNVCNISNTVNSNTVNVLFSKENKNRESSIPYFATHKCIRTDWGDNDPKQIQKILRRQKYSKVRETLSEELPKKEEIKPCPKHDLVEYWNSLPGVRKHENPNSSVYRKSALYFDQLLQGDIGSKWNLNMEWIKDQKINRLILKRKWKKETIEKALKNLSKMYCEGYWPKDKKKAPRDLSNLLYNFRTRKSLFLLVLWLGRPLEIKERSIDPVKNMSISEKNVYNELKEAIVTVRGIPLTNYELKQMSDVAKQVVLEHKKLPIDMNPKLSRWIGTPALLAHEYSEFLKLCYNNFHEMTPNMLLPGAKSWNRFLIHFSEDVGVDVRTGYAINC